MLVVYAMWYLDASGISHPLIITTTTAADKQLSRHLGGVQVVHTCSFYALFVASMSLLLPGFGVICRSKSISSWWVIGYVSPQNPLSPRHDAVWLSSAWKEKQSGEQIIAGGVWTWVLTTNKLMYTMMPCEHPIPHHPIWIAYFLDGYTFFDTQTFWCSWVRSCDAGFLHVGSHNFPGKYMGARTGSCAAQALILCQIAKVSWNVCLWHKGISFEGFFITFPSDRHVAKFCLIDEVITLDTRWWLFFSLKACWPSFKTLFVGWFSLSKLAGQVSKPFLWADFHSQSLLTKFQNPFCGLIFTLKACWPSFKTLFVGWFSLSLN